MHGDIICQGKWTSTKYPIGKYGRQLRPKSRERGTGEENRRNTKLTAKNIRRFVWTAAADEMEINWGDRIAEKSSSRSLKLYQRVPTESLSQLSQAEVIAKLVT